jgi:hypothetical protein
MPLNRRIVLDGPISTPEPEPEKPKKKKTARSLLDNSFEQLGKSYRDFVNRAGSVEFQGTVANVNLPDMSLLMKPGLDLPQATMRNFFAEAGMDIQKDFVRCKNCHDIANFDADFNHKTIMCCTCQRVATFEVFEREHK